MNKTDNPYYSLIGMMQEEGKAFNAVPFFIGKVTATAPLTVQIGELPITKRNMKINSMLSGRWETGEEVLLLRSEDGQQYILVCKLE